MPNETNDITGLNSIKVDKNNNLTAVNITKGENTDINLGFAPNKTQQDQYKTQVEKDSDFSRTQAMDDILSGIPTPEPVLTLAKEPVDLSKSTVTKDFTTRDEIMSNLGLMDEKGNYTDTYTNYVNQGGQPLPGYEYAHKELLDQERYDSIFKQVEDGTMDYDTALMEAYGRDILATMGYDVTSVAYWKNKFLNDDFSNPFANRYIMDQVKQAAEEYHQARLAGEYAHSSAARESSVAALVGQEVDAEKIGDLFPDLKKYADDQNLSDDELRKLVTSGRIDASARLIPSEKEKGTYYYLHTDGQMYILDNKDGDNHGRIELDEKGNIKEISLNSSGVIDFGRHFLSSAASVFTGLGKIGMVLWSVPEAIFTDQSYTEALIDNLADVDSFFNDTEAFNWITDSGHIDMDGFKANDLGDWMFALADISGMVAGGYALGGVGTSFTKLGASAMEGSTSLTSAFSKSASTGLRYAGGKLLTMTGNVVARSTGMYQGAKGTTNNVFSLSIGKFGFNAAKQPTSWAPFANHLLKTVPIYAIKDFYGTVQSLSNQVLQMKLAGEDVSVTNEDIFKQASRVAGINALISAVFAGGVNDNQKQRLKGLFGRKGGVVEEVVNTMHNAKVKVTQENILKYCGDEVLKQFLKERRNTIVMNTAMDLVDNFFTMNIQDSLSKVNKDGTIHSTTELLAQGFTPNTNMIKNAVQATIMTMPTLRGQLNCDEYNVALQSLGMVNKQILDSLDEAMAKAATPEDQQTIRLVKSNYIEKMNSSKADTVEGKIMEAISDLSTNLKEADQKSIPDIVRKAFDKTVTEKKVQFYNALAEETRIKLEIHRKAISDYQQKVVEGGTIKHAIGDMFNKIHNSFGTGLDAASFKYGANAQGIEMIKHADAQTIKMQKDSIDNARRTFVDAYEQVTGTKTSNSLASRLLLKEEDLNLDKAVEFNAFDDLNEKTQDAIKQSSDIPEGQERNYTYFRIKNEAMAGDNTLNDRMKGSIMKASLDILTDNGANKDIFTKVDDDIYASYNFGSGLEMSLKLDTLYKCNAAYSAIKTGDTLTGAKLFLSSVMGDADYDDITESQASIAGENLRTMLDTAYKNNVFELKEAADVLSSLINAEDETLSSALKVIKKDTTMKLSNTANFNELNDIEKQYLTKEAVNEVLHISSDKKLLTSEKTRFALTLLIDEDTMDLNPNVMKYLNGLNLTEKEIQGVKDQILQVAKNNGTVPVTSGRVDDVLQTLSRDNNYEGQSEKDIKHNIRYTLRNKGVDLKKDAQFVKDVEDFVVKIAKKTSQKKLSGNIVTIDNSHIFGDEANKCRQTIINGVANEDEKTLSSQNLVTTMGLQELREQSAAKSKTAFETFNLNDPFERAAFLERAEALHIFEDNTKLDTLEDVRKALRTSVRKSAQEGINYKSGTRDVYNFKDMDKVAERLLERLKTIMPEEYELNIKTQELKKLNAQKIIRNVSKIMNLSPEQAARYKTAGGDLSIIPGKAQDEYIINTISQALVETGEEQTKQGTGAGKLAGKHKLEAMETFTAQIESDPDMSKYFAVRQIIDEVNSQPNKYVFRIAYQSDIENKLHKAGIDSFYNIESDSSNDYVTLRLKPDAKELMYDYLDGKKDVNLFKILPLISSKELQVESNYYRHPEIKNGLLEKDGETTKIPDMHFGSMGVHGSSGEDLLNISFSWDASGSLKKELLFNIFKTAMDAENDISKFDYNPFTEKPSDVKQKLISYYKDTFTKLVTTKSGSSEDYRAWLNEEGVIKTLNDLYQKGELDNISSNDLAKQILKNQKANYIKAHNLYSKDVDYPNYSYSAVYTPGSAARNSLEISPDIIIRAANLSFDPIDTNGKAYYKNAEIDLTKAIDNFKSNIDTYTDYQTYIASNPSSLILYRETPETAFAHSVGASNGYFEIEDLDWINNLSFEQFRNIVDSSVIEKTADAKSLYKGLKDTANLIADKNNKALEGVEVPTITKYSESKIFGTPNKEVENVNGLPLDITNPHINEDLKKLNDMYDANDTLHDNHNRVIKLSDLAYNTTNKMSEELFDRIGMTMDRQARDSFASPANMEILNLQDESYMRDYMMIQSNTKDEIKNLVNKLNLTSVTDKNIEDLVEHLSERILGTTKYTSEYDGYQVINKKDLSVVASIPKAKNPAEVLNILDGLDNLEDTLFLSVNKHDLRSNDAITFKYKDLNSKSEIQSLKGALLGEAVDSMYYTYKNNFDTPKDYYNWISDIAYNDTDKFEAMLEQNMRTNLSKKTLVNIISTNIASMSNSIDNKGARDVLISQVFKNPNYNINGLNALISDNASGLLSEDPTIRAKSEMAIFGVTYNSMSDIQKDAYSNLIKGLNKKLEIRDPEFKKLIKEATRNPLDSKDRNLAITALKKNGYTAEQVAEALIANSKDGASIFYTVSNKQKLASLQEDTPSVSVRLYNSESKLDTKELRDIITKQSDKALYTIDIEGECKKLIKQYTPDEMFQIAIKKHDNSDNVYSVETYFVLHKDAKGNIIMPKEWVKNNVDMDCNFYKSEEGYRDAVKNYLSYNPAGNNSFNFVTIDELKDMIGSDKYITAYNGQGYDFKILEKIAPNNTFIDATEFHATEYAGDNPFTKLNQETVINKNKFSFLDAINKADNKKLAAHDAGADVEALDSWLVGTNEDDGVINSLSDNALKSKMHIKDIVDNVADIYGVEDKDSLYKALDNFFEKDQPINNYQKHFAQEMLDASDTSQILRYLNYLEHDDVGNLLYNFEKTGIYERLGISNTVKDLIENHSYTNFEKGIAKIMASDPNNNIKASQAFNMMQNIAAKELEQSMPEGEYVHKEQILDKLCDEEFINRLNDIDESDDNYTRHLKNFKKSFEGGLKNNFEDMYGLNVDTKAYEDHGALNGFFYNENKIENELNIDSNIKDFYRLRALKPLIANDPSIFDVPIEITLNNKLIKKFADIQRDADKLDSLVVSKINGIYKMIAPLNPDGEPLYEIKPSKTKQGYTVSKNYLKDIKADEIVLTRRAAELINNGKDVSSLFDENGEAYCYSLAYPSAFQNHLDAHKLRIVEGDVARIYATPAVLKLRARDVDGDFLTVFRAETPQQRAIAKITAKYSHTADTIQEHLENYVASLPNAKGVPTEFTTAMQLASNKDILDICKSLDKALSLNKDTSELELKLKETISENLLWYEVDNVDKILEYLGVSSSKGEDFKYVANPLLDDNSFSKQQKKRWVLKNSSESSNVADSTYGYFKKWKLTDAYDDYDITNPLTQLNSTDTILDSQLSEGIKNITTAQQVNGYLTKLLDVLETSTENFSGSQWDKDYKVISDYITNNKTEILKNIDNMDVTHALLEEVTDNVLYAVNYNIRHNADFNAEVKDVLTNNIDTSYKDSIMHNLKLKELKEAVTGTGKHHITKSLQQDPLGAELASAWIKDAINKQSTKYVNDMSKEFTANQGKVAVLIDDLGTAEDAIYVNKNTKLKQGIVTDLILGDKYKMEAIPSEWANMKEPLHLTADEINKIIPNANFKHDVSVLDLKFNGNIPYAVRLVEYIPLGSTKIFNIGKGIEKLITPSSDNETDFDFIINRGIFKDRKLGLSTYFNTSDGEIKTIKVKQMVDGKMKTVSRRAVIFDNVPSYISMDDTQFNENNSQRLEAMAVFGSKESLPGVGIFGSAFYENRDGHFYHTDSFMQPLLEDADTKHNISYSNTVQQVQAVRTDLLAQCINKFNLWHAKNKSNYMDDNINSYNDLIYSALNNKGIASKEYQYMLNGLKEFIISNIGKDTFNKWLQSRTSSEKVYFSPEMERYFAKFAPSTVYKFEDSSDDVAMLKTKAGRKKAQSERATENIQEDWNTAERDIQGYVKDLEDYYIPANELYKMHTGYYPSDEDLITGVHNKVLGYRTSIKGAPTLEGKFKPVDTDWSVNLKDGISDLLVLNDYKNGTGADPDLAISSTINGMRYIKPGEDYDIKALEQAPRNTGLYDALSKNNMKSYYAPKDSFLAYTLYNAADRSNSTNVDKAMAITTRNIDDDIAMTLLKNTFSINNGEIEYKAKDYVTKDTYKNIKAKDAGDLNLRLNKYDYYTHKEIFDKYQPNETKSLKELAKSITPKQKEDIDVQAFRDVMTTVSDAYNKALGSPTISETNVPREIGKTINFTFDYKDTDEVFESSLFEGSGIKIKGEDTANVAVAMKNYSAVAEYAKVEATQNLAKLNTLVSHINSKDFENFCVYNWLQASRELKDTAFESKLEFVGTTETALDSTLKQAYEQFKIQNPRIVEAYNSYVSSLMSLSKQAEQITHEPFKNLYTFLAPYRSTNKNIQYNVVKNAIRNETNFSSYDPTLTEKGLRSNMMFNFFDSGKTIINDMSKIIGLEQMSSTLERQKLLNNTTITDKAYEFLDDNIDVSNLYIKPSDLTSDWYLQIHNDILKTIKYYTDIDIDSTIKGSRNSLEQLQRLYYALDNKSKEQIQDLKNSAVETGEYISLSTVKYNMDNAEDMVVKKSYEDIYNSMWAKIIVAQRLAELNPRIITNVTSFLSGLSKNGYALSNRFGQKISMDSPIRPLNDSSMSFIGDNIELYYNNSNPERFAQYVFEKALTGDIYVAKEDLLNQLEEKMYTRKVPSKLMSFFQDVSKKSAGIQMAMPAKMLSRLARFTGFDYVMGALYNPKTVKYMGQAQREIMNAVHTKGESLKDNDVLREYLMREGQPIGMTGKDPVTFTEDIGTSLSRITDKLASPLAIQNHLGRYAIYLAALEGFENGDPWYGPAYMHKDEIDSLSTNQDKAMFIMDYMLGSPGGFPYLSKKTSGLMMYATFPMNLTRTLGAWGMSIGRLASEGFTQENSKQWMRNVIYPSVGVAGITLASNALISYICELFGIDDETEEEWKKEGVTIDPLATVIGGTPSVTYDSINPIKNLEEMFVKPFTSKYNDTTGKKVYGFLQNNILAKLNPAIKTPIEIATKKDLYGTSAMDTSYQYDYMENAIRKTLGFFVGAGIANNVTDQFKFDSYNDDSTFGSSLWKGLTKGINADLGNQKSWKKGSSNYYAAVQAVRNFAYANNDNSYNAETDDLIDADWLNKRRGTTSKYGEYDQDDYKRINNIIRKMIKSQESPEHVYAVIVQEYNNGVSEATLRRVLNNNSLLRKLSKIDKSKFYSTLSDKELKMVADAIRYEEEFYSLLQEFFPTKSSPYGYLPKRTKYYNKSGSGSSSYYPKSYYPKKPTFVNYYPNSGYSNKKVQFNKPYGSINKVKVDVSPQMGVWKNDYNQVYSPNEWSDNKRKGPVKLLDKDINYINNPYYNNLSEYEKRKKVS